MANLHFGKNNFSKFIKGNGFYIALAICLAGAGFACWAAINGTLNKVSTQQPAAVESESEDNWAFQDTEETARNEQGLPIEQNAQSSSPELSAESQPSQASATTSQSAQDTLETAKTQTPLQDMLFVQPISGDTVNNFSNGDLILDKTMNDWRTHNGIDIQAETGSPVKAVTDGKVQKVYTDSMWGTVVEIKHASGIVSRYCSLTEAVLVKEGDKVEIGQEIGCVGETATAEVSLPTHLHFELLNDGKYVDPLKTIEESKQ